jgi:hypothetical protein
MTNRTAYAFSARIWQHGGNGGWHFVSLPNDLSVEIRENMKWQEEGWGRLRATARIGASEWETAIWFDTKQDTYLLPLKAEIRRKEHLEADQDINVIVWI